MQIVDPKIEEYCISKSNIPSADCQKIETFTRAHVHGAHMMVGKLEASFLGFLLRTINAKRVLELGTFTGYSALAMAENIPSDGEVVSIDHTEITAGFAKNFWKESKEGHKIKCILGNAVNVIPSLIGKFDFIFIDADKKNYLPYLKAVIPLLTETGIIVIDNVLWSGKVLPNAELNGEEEHRATPHIRAVNDFVAKEKGLYGTLIPVRDGMFLIRKISSTY